MIKIIETKCFGIKVEIENNCGKINSDLKETGASKQYNAAMDAIESLVLAHAVAGIDIKTPAYLQGIEEAVQACTDQFE